MRVPVLRARRMATPRARPPLPPPLPAAPNESSLFFIHALAVSEEKRLEEQETYKPFRLLSLSTRDECLDFARKLGRVLVEDSRAVKDTEEAVDEDSGDDDDDDDDLFDALGSSSNRRRLEGLPSDSGELRWVRVRRGQDVLVSWARCHPVTEFPSADLDDANPYANALRAFVSFYNGIEVPLLHALAEEKLEAREERFLHRVGVFNALPSLQPALDWRPVVVVVRRAGTCVAFNLGERLMRGAAIVALGEPGDRGERDGGIEVASFSYGIEAEKDALTQRLYRSGGIAPRTGVPFMVAGGMMREAVVRSTRDDVAFVAFVDDRFDAHAPELWTQPPGVVAVSTRRADDAVRPAARRRGAVRA